MSASPFVFPFFRAFSANGLALAGGKLWTYAAGTATPLATFSDAAGTVPNTNPVILDANGQAQVYLSGQGYKLALTDASDVVQPGWPVDNYYSDLGALANTTDPLLGDALIGVKSPLTGAVARTQHDKNQDLASVFDYMTASEISDVRANALTLDVSLAINTAIISNPDRDVFFPAGTYGIGNPIEWATAQRLVGCGFGTIIKCLASWAPAVPTITASTYAPVLAFPPMLYNKTSIQWWSIEGIQFDGNNKDCYGIYLNENFYGSMENVYVLNTNKRPYTNIRGQSISHRDVVFYLCGDGVLSYDNTNFKFDNCGFERLGGLWSYDQRQPAAFNKGGVKIDDCWFEDAAGNAPADGFLRMAGRRCNVDAHMVHYQAATTERALELIATGATRSIDGITMESNACSEGYFHINNTFGDMLTICGTGTYGNNIGGYLKNTKIADSGSANNFNVMASMATPIQHVTGAFQVRNPASGTTVPIGATDYVMHCDYNGGSPFIRMFGNVLNKIALVSGILEFGSNLSMRMKAGGDIEVQPKATKHIYFYDAAGTSSYSTGHVVLGTYHLWVNSGGKLYIKNGAPTSDTDGTVVGTQT